MPCAPQSHMCLRGFTLFRLCLLQTTDFTPASYATKKSSLKVAPLSWAENGKAGGQKCLRAVSNPFYFSPSCSASSICVGLLLVLLLSCCSGTQLMPALTLWLKTSLSLSFFERLKGGVVWNFCLNKCLNSYSCVWSLFLVFFFSKRGKGNMYTLIWFCGILVLIIFFCL